MGIGAAAPGRRARLGWRSRRGMKELDILLQRWLTARYDGATEVQRARFEALLELPDPDLAAYLLGGLRPADPEVATAIGDILAD
jgi:antitoxin CptB